MRINDHHDNQSAKQNSAGCYVQRDRAKMKLKLAIGEKNALKWTKTNLLPHKMLFTLGNFALECFFTLILLALVLGD